MLMSSTDACCRDDPDVEMLTQLRILSSIRPQDCISTNNQTRPIIRIMNPGMTRGVVRRYYSESREANVNYIRGLLQHVAARYATLRRENKNELATRLQREATGAVRGLRNWQQTYEDDAQFQASVDIAVDGAVAALGLAQTLPAAAVRDDSYCADRETPSPSSTANAKRNRGTRGAGHGGEQSPSSAEDEL